MILQFVERRFAARLQQRTIERLAGLERQLCFERRAMLFRQRLEAAEGRRARREPAPLPRCSTVMLTEVCVSFSFASNDVTRASG